MNINQFTKPILKSFLGLTFFASLSAFAELGCQICSQEVFNEAGKYVGCVTFHFNCPHGKPDYQVFKKAAEQSQVSCQWNLCVDPPFAPSDSIQW